MTNPGPKKKIVALVPLRGGSKSIPLKNIKPIAGKPLCSWSLDALVNCVEVDEVYVSTDSERIASVVREAHPEVKIIERPAEFATDEASTESVILHFSENVAFDLLITVQATSPLVTAEDFSQALEMMNTGGHNSVVTGVRTKRFYWSSDGKPLNYNPSDRPRRQDFDGSLVENGAFYITEREIVERDRCRLGGSIGIHEMGPETELEIDEPEDWEQVEKLLLKNASVICASPKVLVCDVDGTLTDGGMYYGAEGEALKKFNTRDAVGLRRLKESGTDVWVITGEISPSVEARMKKLSIEECHFGVQDKPALLQELCTNKHIDLSEVAFIGDDLNDIECLRMVGLPACPSDAAVEVRRIAGFVSRKQGGDGAVREFCEYLLSLTAN